MDANLLRHISILLLAISSASQEVRTGIVPIFQPRATAQPITFTFTTPNPNKRIVTEYPVNVETNNKFPTLRPETPYSAQNAPWAPSGPVGSISPIIEVPSIDLSVPIYNQAQYFRALQKAGAMSSSNSQEVHVPVIQPKIIPVSTGNSGTPPPAPTRPPTLAPSSPKFTKSASTFAQTMQSDFFWKDVEDAWSKAKIRLSENGAMSDWRRLWEKLTGVLEPFLMEVGQRLGNAVNRAMRQQAGVTWKSEEKN